MKVAWFVPCYIDQFYSQMPVASLELLEKFGVNVSYPEMQACRGQPMANSGFERMTDDCNNLFTGSSSGYDYPVCTSGSCTLHAKDHLHRDNNCTNLCIESLETHFNAVSFFGVRAGNTISTSSI